MKISAEQKPPGARELLATNVRVLRTALGVSQEELAVSSGFHRTYVSHVERCRANVTMDGLDKLAAGLHVPVARLFRYSEPGKQ